MPTYRFARNVPGTAYQTVTAASEDLAWEALTDEGWSIELGSFPKDTDDVELLDVEAEGHGGNVDDIIALLQEIEDDFAGRQIVARDEIGEGY